MGYIYALIHPWTKEIRYIGKTIAPLEIRLARHINQCKTGKSHVKSWIRSLRRLNINPLIIIIEECNNGLLNEREIYWISYYSNRNNLCNLTNGGEGGSRNSKYALIIKNKMNSVIELVKKGVKLKDAERQIGLPNGYLSRARRGNIQFINDNNILVPNLQKKPNNRNRIIDDRTGAIYNTQNEAAKLLGIHKKTVYNMIKAGKHLRLSK